MRLVTIEQMRCPYSTEIPCTTLRTVSFSFSGTPGVDYDCSLRMTDETIQDPNCTMTAYTAQLQYWNGNDAYRVCDQWGRCDDSTF